MKDYNTLSAQEIADQALKDLLDNEVTEESNDSLLDLYWNDIMDNDC